MRTFIVTLRGAHVFHECSLVGTIPGTNDPILDYVAEIIGKRYNLEVYDFSRRNGIWCAFTSDNDVKVFIEEVSEL